MPGKTRKPAHTNRSLKQIEEGRKSTRSVTKPRNTNEEGFNLHPYSVTPTQEEWCRWVMAGHSYANAVRLTFKMDDGKGEWPKSYDKSGVKRVTPATVRGQANNMVRNPSIQRRIISLWKERERERRHSANYISGLAVEKLLELADNAETDMAKLRAIELLGKLHHVGLFTDRKEVTVKHEMSAEEVRERLFNRLESAGIILEGKAD